MANPNPDGPQLGILDKLGLTQPSPWETPTILDHILDSPIRLIAIILYTIHVKVYTTIYDLAQYIVTRLPANLRAIGLNDAPIRNARPLRVVCISDTHDATVPLPDGDLLIHAGDLTNQGRAVDIQKQIDWLGEQMHEHVVVIPGNHDSFFDPEVRSKRDKDWLEEIKYPQGVHYLQCGATTLRFSGGQKVQVYGRGDVPECGPSHFAYQYQRDPDYWKDCVPNGTDILVTHTPPAFHRDLYRHGCTSLLAEVWRVRPALHVFGHIHRSAGRQLIPFSPLQKRYEALMKRPCKGVLHDVLSFREWIPELLPFVIITVTSIWLSPVQVVWAVWRMRQGEMPRPTIAVNAAQQVGSTDKMRGVVEVVDLEVKGSLFSDGKAS